MIPNMFRYKDLSNELLISMDDLETYAECGHSSILYLILEILDVQNKNAEFAASHIGVSSGIVTTLRGFPHHSAKVISF
jgi:NADH dehydrogenase [ubiquinone] 1 alpha subcomplex assembly factor 6